MSLFQIPRVLELLDGILGVKHLTSGVIPQYFTVLTLLYRRLYPDFSILYFTLSFDVLQNRAPLSITRRGCGGDVGSTWNIDVPASHSRSGS